MRSSRFLAAAVLSASAGVAQADFVFSPFSVFSTESFGNVRLNGPSSGVYRSYSVRFNWNSFGGAFSREAVLGFSEAGFEPDGSVVSGDAYGLPRRFLTGSRPDEVATVLSVRANFDQAYVGGRDLFFGFQQDSLPFGSVARWGDIDITLFEEAFAPPTPFSLLTLRTFDRFEPIDINTFGSPTDTEVAIYSGSGRLIGTNDNAGGGLQSQIELAGGLDVGTYYIAVTPSNTDFAADFANYGRGGGVSGPFTLNINDFSASRSSIGTSVDPNAIWYQFDVVPAPGSAAVLALGGLAAARRRRH